MSRVVASTWGALADYSIIVDPQTGNLVQLGRLFMFAGIVYAQVLNGAIVRNVDDRVALVEPDDADAIVNMLRAGFVVQVLGAIGADDALAGNGESVTFISTTTLAVD
jgi:hypothetical protein